ncbi:MAG: PQQ-dependent sugar dehydrogenase [Myxococcales bacterium]|nr:PQQ-dependent sugar dehydrogenase [Myxococcales bacterium]
MSDASRGHLSTSSSPATRRVLAARAPRHVRPSVGRLRPFVGCALGVASSVLWLMGCDPSSQAATATLERRPTNTSCVAPPRPSGGARLRLEPVFSSVRPSRAVAMLEVEADRFLLAEQAGRLSVFDRAGGPARLFADLTDRVDASEYEGGLLGVALHPDFARNRWVFVSYTARVAGRLTSRVSRFEASTSGDRLLTASERVVLEVAQPAANHNGGHVAFGPDGMLYVALGDGGGANDPFRTSQDLGSLLGKILRLDVGRIPYAIPADNPFRGVSGARAEIWAYGLRNPWRFSFDRATGALYAGDVGQDEREEINLIVRGGNYGWSLREGTRCLRAGCERDGLIDPVVEYGRDAGISVTGGYVYRGAEISWLAGRYVFGDFGSGNVWALDEDARSGTARMERVADGSGVSIVSFAEDRRGELYVLGWAPSQGRIYRLVADRSPTVDLPERLSATGCVDPARPWLPASGLIPYDVAAPLYSDDADKARWIALPEGTRIATRPDGSLELPIGAVLVKQFARAGRLLETRLLVRHDDGEWAGYTYVWNEAQTDATLARGATRIPAADWDVPSRGDCLRCHTEAAGRVLGFRLPQLAREVGGADQIDTFARIGLFDRRDVRAPFALPDPFDADAAPLDARARAYLDVNCGSCHLPGGPGRGAFDLRFETPYEAQGLCDARPALGDRGLRDARLVAPGAPERSVLAHRMRGRGEGQMPPLGTTRRHDAGTELVDAWIRSQRGCEGSDRRRTVILFRRETQPGQDIFIRGGLDHGQMAGRGVTCTAENLRCAIPIVSLNPFFGRGDAWLDWYGREPGQPSDAFGTPLAWTTDRWPSAWGARRTVAEHGFGETPLNRVGPHAWMLDVEMDCARTIDGWFEFKAYLRGGGGWEPDVSQSGTPYRSNNHFGRCGHLNVVSWGSGTLQATPL